MAVPITTREMIVKRRLQGHSLASTAMGSILVMIPSRIYGDATGCAVSLV